jgi:hypothetical protein
MGETVDRKLHRTASHCPGGGKVLRIDHRYQFWAGQ